MADDQYHHGRIDEKRGPTQQGPRRQEQIDAQDRLRNDPTLNADYQQGLDAAADRNHALGDSTGNEPRATQASGRRDDGEHTAEEALQAFRETRGDRQPRDVKGRD